MLGKNKTLRLEIDNIRKEKVIFETLYSKLETELVRKKHQVNDVIEVASGAYEERNKIQAKMAELIQQSQKEQQEFDNEIRTVQELIDQDDEMKSKIKKISHMNNKSLHGHTGDKNDEGLDELKKLTKQKIFSFEEAFVKLMKALQFTNLEDLVTCFVKAEEKNFSLFKFVNELNNEIDNFKTQILEIETEIKRNFDEGGHDSLKRKAIKELEKKLQNTKQSIIDMNKRREENTDKIDQIKKQIDNICKVIEVNEVVNEDLLGN